MVMPPAERNRPVEDEEDGQGHPMPQGYFLAARDPQSADNNHQRPNPIIYHNPPRHCSIIGMLGYLLAVAVILGTIFHNNGSSDTTGDHTPVETSFVQERAAKEVLKSNPSMMPQWSLNELLHKAGWALVAVYNGNKPAPKQRWTSQLGQENTVLDILDYKHEGFFVDLAANDAVAISNTLTLEQEYGWHGLCIEPNPSYAPGFYPRSCQLVQAAVGHEDNKEVTFNFGDTSDQMIYGAFGGVVGKQFDNQPDGGRDGKYAWGEKTAKMLTVSLDKTFKDLGVPKVIDYLSLDIEVGRTSRGTSYYCVLLGVNALDCSYHIYRNPLFRFLKSLLTTLSLLLLLQLLLLLLLLLPPHYYPPPLPIVTNPSLLSSPLHLEYHHRVPSGG